MADFYQELLGSLDQSPLDQLARRDNARAPVSKPLVAENSTFRAALSRSFTPPSSGVSPIGTDLRNKLVASTAKPLFVAEASVAKGVLSSPVLKGALPKLAPVAQQYESLEQKIVEQDAVWVLEDERKPVEERVVAVPLVPEKPDVVKVISTRKGSDVRPVSKEAEHVRLQRESTALVSKKSVAWHENGRPHWAQDRFECLLFVVGGLTLAVPLVSLGAIYRIDDELTPLVGRASWFMGLYRQGERTVHVVDTAQWVMPDRWVPSMRENYRFVIRLGDENWGVATDSVQQSINLAPAQVKWRTDRSRRPWLAGTVVDHMCALLDVDRLAEMLSQSAAPSKS